MDNVAALCGAGTNNKQGKARRTFNMLFDILCGRGSGYSNANWLNKGQQTIAGQYSHVCVAVAVSVCMCVCVCAAGKLITMVHFING